MDFSLSEEQSELLGLAKKIFKDMTGDESLRAVEAADGLHRELWAALGDAGLLGLGLPEEVGGLGMGDLTDVLLLVEQAARHVAPVPLLESIVVGAHGLARWGSLDAQSDADIEGVVTGRAILSAGLLEAGGADPLHPGTTASLDGEGWRLSGIKAAVPFLSNAHRVLVTARLPDGSAGTFLVDPAGAGATIHAGTGTHDLPLGALSLDGYIAPSEHLLGGEEPARATAWIIDRAQTGLCALALGLSGKALHLTAKYVTERKQFGVPLATFQAVSQRAGDAWIDVESVRLVVQRAGWLLAQERAAAKEVAVARVITADAAHRVACSAIHLHGGMGFDRDYPLYRYFLWTKHVEFLLGATSAQVAHLGNLLASEART